MATIQRLGQWGWPYLLQRAYRPAGHPWAYCRADLPTAPMLKTLTELAEATAGNATDLYTFTSCINNRFDSDQKLRMIELMWAVAYADGHLEAHERHVMWRIADLLHVPQGSYQAARQRAEQARGA
jgi:uncharacterized tellurite resistance protein B-like protein